MAKRFFAFFITIILLFTCCFVAHADEGEKKSGLFTYKLKGNGNAIITGFNWSSNGGNDIYIPRQVDGYTVSEIGAYAFSSKSQTESFGDYIGQSVVVVIPDTVTMIGEKAFFCTCINTVSIPSSVAYIGPGAFSGCINIKDHYVQTGNNTYATIDGVLYNKKEKELISIPAGKEYDKGISIPDGIVSIAPYAFYGINASLKNTDHPSNESRMIRFPDSLKRIGEYAFAYSSFDCTAIKKGGKEWWSEDTKYKTMWTFGKIQEIGDYAFYNAEIENALFDFSNNSIETIGDFAFANAKCTRDLSNAEVDKLLPIVFSSTIDRIGKNSFESFTCKISGFLVSDFTIDLSNTNIEEIPSNAFHKTNISYGRKISLPKKLKAIGDSAFQEIGSLGSGTIYESKSISITIPSTIETIAEKAFCMSNLKIYFETPSNLKTIGEKAFYGSMIWPYAADTIAIPEGVLSIGSQAFDMYGHFVLSIPSTVTSIGENVIDRTRFKLSVTSGSYAAVYASENGYLTVGNEDTSWLND